MQLPYPTTSVMILSLVERHGPARVGELADVAHVDASVISRQLATLEHEGLVARSPDPRDGRAHQIGITTQGALMLAEGRRRLEELVTERLAGWDAGTLTTLADGVRRLLTDLHG
jgi:DNA-binding MarR family transcriptional regulator